MRSNVILYMDKNSWKVIQNILFCNAQKKK